MKNEVDCLLEITPGKYEKCRVGECAECGWRRENNVKRHERIKKEGLTECEDGLWRLIIEKKGGTEDG